MIFIGLISYSAYLWHWPLISFSRYGLFEATLLLNSFIFLITLLLAWLSYLYIEQPFRYTKGTMTVVLSRQYLMPSSVLMLIAIDSYQLDGYGLRLLYNTYQQKEQAALTEVKPAFSYTTAVLVAFYIDFTHFL